MTPIKGEQMIDKKKNIRILLYQKEDIKLQEKQNDLIKFNTKITIILGAGAIIAQLIEVLINLIR
jgi:hypothetical protein